MNVTRTFERRETEPLDDVEAQRKFSCPLARAPMGVNVCRRMIDAVLFDLDETITDRSASLAKYAALFHRAFAGFLGPIPVEQIEATFLALDNRGYRLAAISSESRAPDSRAAGGPSVFPLSKWQCGMIRACGNAGSKNVSQPS